MSARDRHRRERQLDRDLSRSCDERRPGQHEQRVGRKVRRGKTASRSVAASALEVAAESLLALDRLEQRLEVALAEGARAVALDHLEEQRRPVLRGFVKIWSR